MPDRHLESYHYGFGLPIECVPAISKALAELTGKGFHEKPGENRIFVGDYEVLLRYETCESLMSGERLNVDASVSSLDNTGSHFLIEQILGSYGFRKNSNFTSLSNL